MSQKFGNSHNGWEGKIMSSLGCFKQIAQSVVKTESSRSSSPAPIIIIGCVLSSLLSNGVNFVIGEASTFIILLTNCIKAIQGDQDGQTPRGGEVDQQAVSQSHHAGDGGVYLEEAVKNAQEEDNTATSAVIDVGEIDSVDEVIVATAVKEEDSNIWVRSVVLFSSELGMAWVSLGMSLGRHTMSYQGNMYNVTVFVNKLYFVCFMKKDYTEVGSFLYEFKGFNFFLKQKSIPTILSP
jgi:hypothetical protein